MTNTEYKKCPHCSGTIKALAIKCKHCKEMINGMNARDDVKICEAETVVPSGTATLKHSIGGTLGYHGLGEWWLSAFSDHERNHIVNTFKPLGDSGESLVSGNVLHSSLTSIRLLFDLSGWFNKNEDRHIAYKLLEKAEQLLNEDSNILDMHFLYQAKINAYYKNRDIEPIALEIAIEACKKQIAIAPKTKAAFKKEFKNSPLPSHKGYTQLAIIEEKRKNFEEVIELSQKALKQGWNGDWEKRIERCFKKIDIK